MNFLQSIRFYLRSIIVPIDKLVNIIKDTHVKESELLDIGAGTGFILNKLIEKGIIDYGYGTEITLKYIKKTDNFEINFYQKIDKKFKTILLIDVLHHIPNKKEFLAEMVGKFSYHNTMVVIKDISPEKFLYRSWNTLHDVIFNQDTPQYISENNLQEVMLILGFELKKIEKERIFLYDHYFHVYQKI